MAFQAEIQTIVVQTMLGIRQGVGQCRIAEFKAYLEDLIQAKEAGLEVSTVQLPMMTDRVKQGCEGAIAIKTDLNAEGGIQISLIKLGGSYGKSTQEAIKIKVDMEFMSPGSPDFERIAALSVEDLRKLMEVVEK